MMANCVPRAILFGEVIITPAEFAPFASLQIGKPGCAADVGRLNDW